MKAEGWDTVILSEPSHEHLIAEVHFDGQLIAQLDREEGREAICVSLMPFSRQRGARIRLQDLLQALQTAAVDLAR